MADFRESSTDPAIKVGANAPVTADNAMVVSVSPNSAALAVARADAVATGSLAAAAQTVELALNWAGSASVQLSGTWVGTVAFEITTDNLTWLPINATQLSVGPINLQATTVNGLYAIAVGSLAKVRANMTVFTSGSATVNIRSSASPISTFLNQPLPSGNNTVGAVRITDGTTLVKVSAAGEQLVSFADLVPAAQSITAQDIVSATATGANGQAIITGAATAGSTVSLTTSGDSSFAILVSGTWTGTLQFERSLDAGATFTAVGAFAAGTAFIVPTTTSNGAFHGNSSSATTLRVRSTAVMTGTATIKLLAGSGTGTVTVGNPLRLFDRVSGVEHTIKATATAVAAADTALVVGLHPSSPLPTGGNTIGTALMASVTALTVLSVANTAATLSLPAPAAGQFHYITRLRITLHNTSAAAVVGSAVALAFTSTNLPGALAWTDGNALAAGTSKTVVDEQLENPIKSSAAATATTITAPIAGAGVQSRITAYYYTGV